MIFDLIKKEVLQMKSKKPHLFVCTFQYNIDGAAEIFSIEEYDRYFGECLENIANDILGILSKNKNIDKELSEDDDLLTEVKDFIIKNIEVDVDQPKISARIGVYPYQFDNFNTEGMEFGEWIQDKLRNPDEKVVTDDAPEAIYELFKSQGYKIEDIENPEKVSNSDFLKSFVREIDSLIGNPSSMLGFFIEIPFSDYLRIIESRDLVTHKKTRSLDGSITFSVDTPCGIVSPVYGGGSAVEIKLEKEWTVPLNCCNFVGLKKATYGYPLDEAYGKMKTLALCLS